MKMPKSYAQSIRSEIKPVKSQISEGQNRIPDKIKLELPAGTLLPNSTALSKMNLYDYG
jgi:hypothetical protein